MKGRIISIAVAFALLAALVYYSGFDKVVQAVSNADLRILALAFAMWPLNVLLRTQRWRYLLGKVGCKPPWWPTIKVFIASLFLSNVTPGKTGDPLRSVLLKKVNGDSVALTLPSVIMERILDIICLTLIGAVGIIFTATKVQSTFLFWFMAAIAVYAVGIIAGLYILASEDRIKKFSHLIIRLFSFVPKLKTYAEKMEGFAENLHSSFAVYSSKRTIAISLIYSMVLWLFEGFIIYLSFLTLGFHLPYTVVVTAMCASTLISVLTFLPGGVGSSEAITTVFIVSVTALTAADVVAASLIARFVSYWVYVVAGTIVLATVNYKYKM